MKKLLVFVLMLGAFVGISQQFKDVPVNHWAYEAVMEMSKLGVLTGMPDERSRVTPTSPGIRQRWRSTDSTTYSNNLLRTFPD